VSDNSKQRDTKLLVVALVGPIDVLATIGTLSRLQTFLALCGFYWFVYLGF